MTFQICLAVVLATLGIAIAVGCMTVFRKLEDYDPLWHIRLQGKIFTSQIEYERKSHEELL